MDRKPLPAPFPVGTRLRYVGDGEFAFIAKDGTRVPYKECGLKVVVDRTAPGRRGTLREIPMAYRDEEPLFDTTEDGYSVYSVSVDGERFGRIIWPKDAHDWEVVDG